MSKVKTVYLCGPIAGCTHLEKRGWRDMVDRFLDSEGVGINQVALLDPCRREPSPAVVGLDKQDILASDLVLAYPWKPGFGTAMEIMYCHNEGRPVWAVQDKGEANIWVAAHARVFTSWEGCLAALLEWAKNDS